MGIRTKALLGRGYFPSQLPPGFVTTSFAAIAEVLRQKWEKSGVKPKTSLLEHFSVARTGLRRRVVSIPNPISFLYLCNAIDKDWPSIRRHLTKSKLSASTPKITDGDARAVTSRPLNELYPLKILRSRGYQYMLRSDISRYFPTIYTHSLSWALHSKAEAKRKRKGDALLGNRLDTAVQRCQDSQTLGIPIGPDTSHILAEIVGVAIDVSLRSDLGFWPAGFRFVDDYFLFFESQADAEQALAKLSAKLKDYELEINFDKTEVIPIHALSEDSWTRAFRSLDIQRKGVAQLASIHHYFDAALELCRSNPSESVIKYALRKISKVVIRKENWSAFEAHLLRATLAQPSALQVVTAFLCTYERYGYPLDRESISKICAQIIEKSAPLNHHSEVIWALWICKELKLRLRASVTRALDRVDSACCKLVALDLESRGLLAGRLRRVLLKSQMRPDALFGDAWILSYEAGRRGWAGLSRAHIDSCVHFKELLSRNVEFYDVDASVPLLFTPKDQVLAAIGVDTEAELFDKDIDLEKFLEFEEPAVDYQDEPSVATAEDFDDLTEF